ncbi:MAG: ribosome biogenesis GTPase Der [Phycisphaerales bacterium]
MSIPRVAIVGRPNVGKSSLLNLIARRRVSIVDPTPGVTRDRISVFVDLEPPVDSVYEESDKTFELIDTGGYGVYSGEESDADARSLTADIEYQITQAIQKADLILFVIDVQSGLAPLDEAVTSILRDQNATDRVRLVANKVDSEKWLNHAYEAASLGLGEPLVISATSGFGKREFLDALYQMLPEASGVAEPEMKLAIIGRRNAGKSTLVNALAGEQRMIVSEIAGTTRDSVDVRFEIEGRSFVAIDTAGVRKRKSIQDDVEYYSFRRSLRSIRRADVVVHLIDATVPISRVDQQLAAECEKQFKPILLALNKWDLVEGKLDRKKQPITPESYLDHLSKEMPSLEYAPVVFLSAKENDGVRDVVAMALNLYEQASHRESTGRVNAAIKRIFERRGPSSRLGKQAKVLYASQVATHPPTLVLVVNHKELFEGGYERYLLNRLREELPYSEVPIRILFRDRKRIPLGELKAGRGRDADYEDGDDEDD